MLVLSCLKLSAQVIHSTGNKIHSDSVCVSIPIEYIRLANQKLIERNYLIEVNQYKDSIIVDYKKYIEEYERISEETRAKFELYDSINKDLHKKLDNQKKTSLVFGSIAGASILTIILMGIVN